MSQIDELRRAVTDTLEAVRPFVEATSKLNWSSSDGMLPLLRTSMLRRQHECLQVAATLVEKSQGYAVVGLLRAACEEYLWAKYLASIPRSDAEALLSLLGQKEIADSLKAQDDYVGRTNTKALGLADHLAHHENSAKRLNIQIKALGKKLRWEERTVQASKLPSVAFVAKAVNEMKLCRFLYHASSRYVHFSPTELLRRTWGRTGNVSVSSSHFADYWGLFVLYWGVWLLAHTLPILVELGIDEEQLQLIDSDKLLDAAQRIAGVGPTPIITAEELRWETDADDA